MVKSFDDLLDYLLEQISLSGRKGASQPDVNVFLRKFYHISDGHSSRKSDVAAGTSAAPARSQNIDDAFQRTVWAWVVAHSDIRQELVKASNGEEFPRLFATSERMWQSIAGHGEDSKKVFPLEFDLLAIIASRGEEGVLQPELTALTGQDKRSVPKRTDALHRKGYIVKSPYTINGPRTSLCRLSRFCGFKGDISRDNSTAFGHEGLPIAEDEQLLAIENDKLSMVQNAAEDQCINGQSNFMDQEHFRWSPDKPANNVIFDAVDAAGLKGIGTNEIAEAAFGKFWRKPTEHILSHLTDAWQESQPPHLRHLAVVRDVTQDEKIVRFVYRSHENFQKAVDAGTATWEAVTVSPYSSQGTSAVLGAFGQPGFRPIPSQSLLYSDGSASLLQCRKILKASSDQQYSRKIKRDLETGTKASSSTPSRTQGPLESSSNLVRRPRGRPRKYPKVYTSEQSTMSQNSQSTVSESLPANPIVTTYVAQFEANDQNHWLGDITWSRHRPVPRNLIIKSKARLVSPLYSKAQHGPRMKKRKLDEIHIEKQTSSDTSAALIVDNSVAVGQSHQPTHKKRKAAVTLYDSESLSKRIRRQPDRASLGTVSRNPKPIAPGARSLPETNEVLFLETSKDNTSAVVHNAHLSVSTENTSVISAISDVAAADNHYPKTTELVSMTDDSSNTFMEYPDRRISGNSAQTSLLDLSFASPVKRRSLKKEKNLSDSPSVSKKTQVILNILDEAGGAYPGNDEIWYPFVTAWDKDTKKPQTVHRDAVTRAVKNLLDSAKIRNITFVFRDKHGFQIKRSIVTRMNIQPTSKVVTDTQKNIISSFPKIFLPGSVEVSPSLRKMAESFEFGALEAHVQLQDQNRRLEHPGTSPVDTLRRKTATRSAQKRSSGVSLPLKPLTASLSVRNSATKGTIGGGEDDEIPNTIANMLLDDSRPTSGGNIANFPLQRVNWEIDQVQKWEIRNMNTISSVMSRNHTQFVHLGPGFLPSHAPQSEVSTAFDHPAQDDVSTIHSNFTATSEDARPNQSDKSRHPEWEVRFEPPETVERRTVTRLPPEKPFRRGPSKKKDLAMAHNSTAIRANITTSKTAPYRTSETPITDHPVSLGANTSRLSHVLKEPSFSTIDQSTSVSSKRAKRAKRTGPFSDEEREHFMLIVIVVQTLLGGTGSSVDWELVKQISKLDAQPSTFRNRYKAISTQYSLQIAKLQSEFQDHFLDAYEKGEISPINFGDLNNFDWDKLVEWAKEKMKISIGETLPLIPLTRTSFEAQFMIREQAHYIPPLEECFAPLTTITRREEILSEIPFSLPLRPAKYISSSKDYLQIRPDEIEDDHIIGVVESNVRANIMTNLSNYDAPKARSRLLPFGEQNLDSAIQRLLNIGIFRQENKGRVAPGRNFSVADRFYTMLKSRLEIESIFQGATRYKEVLDQAMRAEQWTEFSFHAQDGELVITLDLIAAGMLESDVIMPESTEAPEDQDDETKLSIWGFGTGNYKTGQMDRTKLIFKVRLAPTELYREGSFCEHPLPPPPSPHLGDKDMGIPLWYDIHDRLLPRMWEIIVALVVSSLVLQSGSSSKSIVKRCKGAVAVWEVEMALEWLSGIGVAKKIGDGWVALSGWWEVLGLGSEIPDA